VPHAPLSVGGAEVVPLCDARIPLPIDDEAPAELGPDGWGAVRSVYPWAFAGPHAWDLHVHAFAVRIAGSLVLIDTGIGTAPPPAWGALEGSLMSELALASITPGEVDHVVLSHVHRDHIGGATGADGEPAFPYATYHLHPADWAAAVDADAAPVREAFERSIRPIADRDRLAVVAEDHEVVPGLRLLHAPGHTPGHRAVAVASEGEELLLVGDALHHPFQVELAGWASPADADPALASQTRRRLLASANETGAVVGAAHLAEPFGRVVEGRWTVA
jgi:glyoxylase-like metal-dependent hydrolase (beta-lactamase superfamily II)